MDEKRKKLIMPWIAIAIILIVVPLSRYVLLPFLWGPIGANITYSSGERVGKIIKIADKGLIWKTTEAEMVLSQGGFSVTYVWDFSVDENSINKNILKTDLQKAFDSGANIKVEYEQKAGFVPWRSKTTYLVQDIKFENQ